MNTATKSSVQCQVMGGNPVRIEPGARFCLGWERAAEVARHAAKFFSGEAAFKQ